MPSSLHPLAERLHVAFTQHWGWRYSLTSPQILTWLPGIPVELKRAVVPRGTVGQTNCTVLGAWLVRATMEPHWVEDLWLDIQVGRGVKRPWSGIEGLVKHGLGVRDDAMTEPGVYATQRWSRLTAAGHIETRDGYPKSFGHFCFVTKQQNGHLYIREASQSRGGIAARLAAASVISTWGTVRAVRLRED